jgi:hypothetical protein
MWPYRYDHNLLFECQAGMSSNPNAFSLWWTYKKYLKFQDKRAIWLANTRHMMLVNLYN